MYDSVSNFFCDRTIKGINRKKEFFNAKRNFIFGSGFLLYN